jgi:membrane-associated phospholipid phosphatase
LWPLPRDWFILRHWQARLIWLLMLTTPACATDRAVFLWFRQSAARGWTEDFSRAARQFGEPAGVAFVIAGIFLLDKQRKRFLVPLVAAVLLSSVASSNLKLLVGRERPGVTAGATILRGPRLPSSGDFNPSFPSGHTATAFALAYGLGQIYPSALRLFILYAVTCGLSRILNGSHFVSDVLVGAWLGWETANLLWNSRKPRHWVARLRRACGSGHNAE